MMKQAVVVPTSNVSHPGWNSRFGLAAVSACLVVAVFGVGLILAQPIPRRPPLLTAARGPPALDWA